jgi:benzoyl-CoA reductase/2-hydroxyglutaryl-CoA dehydratase subunit BcrC/BadD/HgdB
MTEETVHAGLFNRALGLFSLIEGIRRIPSDEEVEGLLRVLPPESRSNLSAFFEPHVRSSGILFLRMIMDWMYAARDAHEQGKKIILVPFNFPPELVLAFDNAVPLTSEVLTTIAAVGLEGGGERYWEYMMGLGLPDHICSSNSIEVGSVLSGHDIVPDAIISAAPGGCDANSKIHEFLSTLLGIPQFLLEKPVDDSPEGHDLYRKFYGKLIRQLEEFLDEELTEEKLRRTLKGANRCTELYWDLYELHKAKPCPVPNLFKLFLAPARFCLWGTHSVIELFEQMVKDSLVRYEKQQYPAEEERARVLWAYTSYYFSLTNLYSWMEQQGYTFLADVLDLYMPTPIDLTSRETMIDGMVDTAWNYPMNKQMAAPSMSQGWSRDVLHIARDLGADCVVYCGHDACKQSWSVVSILRDELMKQAGIPLLTLHGDSWMKTTTPMSALQQDIVSFLEGVVVGDGGKEKTQTQKRRVRRRGLRVEA